MDSLLLHQLVAVDGVFADHVVEMPEMRLPVGKGRACVSYPCLCACTAVVLIVVELRGHEGQDFLSIELACFSLLELCPHGEDFHWIMLQAISIACINL